MTIHDNPNFRDVRFDEEGSVVDFGVPQEKFEELIRSGTPFRTSGCPGKEDDVSACNRPYGDSSPTDIHRDLHLDQATTLPLPNKERILSGHTR